MTLTTLNPSQLLELITCVFLGKTPSIPTDSIINLPVGLFPDTKITNEETYIELKKFEFDIKYDFLFTLTKQIVDLVGGSAATLTQRDLLIDSYYIHFKNITKASTNTLTLVRDKDDNVVSLILGKNLPKTSGKTSYDDWGIPENAPIYQELNLVSQESTYTTTGKHSSECLIVVSKDYFRVGPLEYCNDEFNLLINSANKSLFISDDSVGGSRKLYDIVTYAQTEHVNINNQLLDRVDLPRDSTHVWYSSRNKNSHLVLVDSKALENTLGYVKLKITTDENSFGRKLVALKEDSNTEFLWKNVSIIDKTKQIKSDRYSIAAESDNGILYTVEKTSKHQAIRKKTENTKIFRADLCNSLLYHVVSLILGSELNTHNLDGQLFDPFINADHISDYECFKRDSNSIPATIKSAGNDAVFQWLMTEADNMLQSSENEFRKTFSALAVYTLETNKRANFFTQLESLIPGKLRGRPFFELATHSSVLGTYRDDDGLLKFNDKSNISFNFRQIFRLFKVVKGSRSYYNRKNTDTVVISTHNKLSEFYLDNFIPQAEVEEALRKFTTDSMVNLWSNQRGIRIGDIPESEILVDEVITLNSEATSLIRSTAAIKTFSDLKNWWTFAKIHLLHETRPALCSKLPTSSKELLELNMKVYYKYVDIAMEILETNEQTYLTSTETT